MHKTQVQSLDLEDPLEKEMATYSSILAWKIPWTEKPGGLLSLGQEDPLEEEMATHPSIIVWRISWTEEPGGYSPWGHKESDTIE